MNSISHENKFGGQRTIRLSLLEVRALLQRPELKDFNLTDYSRRKLQRRFREYCRHSSPVFCGYVSNHLPSRRAMEAALKIK